MKLQIISYLFAILVLASCGKEESVKNIVAKGDIEAIRTKKKELSEQQRELEKSMAMLDSAINMLDNSQKLPLVNTFKVEETKFNHYIELQGEVTTRQNVLIYPEVAGRLVRIYVSPGQEVQKGQLLADIDDGGLSNQLVQLKTQLALAKTTYERQNRLWDQKIGTEIQYLQAKTSYEAQQNSVDQFEAQLSKFKMRAPFSGIIDDVIQDQGTVVAPGPGAEVFRIVNLSEMYVEVAVPENFIPSITKGKDVKVEFVVLGKTINSTISKTSNFINPANRSFNIEIPVPSLDGLVKPNLTAKVYINDYINEKALLVPQSVISENAEGEQYAYIANDYNDGIATAQKNIIETGKTQGDLVEVLSGLANGNLVIKEGARSVKDGQQVKVLSN